MLLVLIALPVVICHTVQSKMFRSVLTSYMLCVKQGALKNGMVAVKKLSQSTNDLSDTQFLDEVKCLKRVKHQNIVRFLGYCVESHGEVIEIDGKHVIAEVKQRLLCFEYVPNGSLHDYLQGIKVAALHCSSSFVLMNPTKSAIPSPVHVRHG